MKSGKGFTLVELLVVLAIITVIVSVVFTNQGSFNKTFMLTNTAYDVALSLRDAETFGIGSRAAGSTANAGYGLHFQMNTPGTFILFADTLPLGSTGTPNCPSPASTGAPDCKPGDDVYTSSTESPPINTYTLGNGITLTDFCAYTTSWVCTYAHNGALGTLTSLDIVFARPNPTPFMRINGSSASAASQACLQLASPQGTYRYVSVSSSGQITANTASCP